MIYYIKPPKLVFLFLAVTASLLLYSCKKEFIEKNILTASSVSENATLKQPNIILLIADDMGNEIPNYTGGQSYSTPNLNLMASAGINFSHFYAHPDGPPSRLALFTGKYNYRNWVKFGLLPASEKTFGNLLKGAGYNTCYVGKWQFDGGDTSIVNHGFDKYLVFMPFEPDNNNGHDQFYRRYKNPYLYSDARYLADSEVVGKYSEDMFFDYASNFIATNKMKPFLLVYSFNLIQKPWVPTPDNPEFTTWDPAKDDDKKGGETYFPEMVKYLDKMVGKIISKTASAGIINNTIVMFVSDNATKQSISSKYNDTIVKGTKSTTTVPGTNVPFLAYAPGVITNPGSVDSSLTDMTDFFPSMANMAGVSVNNWQPLDGTTFYDNLSGVLKKQRSYVYCYWPQYSRNQPSISYVFDYNYKLYDSAKGNRFYNIALDKNEKSPIPKTQLNEEEKKIRNKFRRILNQSIQ